MSRGPRTRIHRHLTFGLVLESDLRLPLPPAGGAARADLRFRLLPAASPVALPGPLETYLERKDGSPLVSWARAGGGVLLRCDGSADFHATAALGRVTCRPVPGAGRRELAALFVDNVLPLLLAWRGEFVLHASAVRIGDGAVAFVGPRGAGKSTLAAFLARRGHAVLADDALLLRLRRGRPVVVPGPSSVRLEARAFRRLLGRNPGEGGGKGRAGFPAGGSKEIPLRRILLLSPKGKGRRPTRLVLSPARGRKAMMALTGAQFLLGWSSREGIRKRFVTSETLVSKGFVMDARAPYLGSVKCSRPGHLENDILCGASDCDD